MDLLASRTGGDDGHDTEIRAALLSGPRQTHYTAMRSATQTPLARRYHGGRWTRQNWREYVWSVVHFRARKPKHERTFWHSRAFEASILLLIFVNVLAVFIDEGTPENLEQTYYSWAEFEKVLVVFSLLVFSAEYFLQFWACVEDERYEGICGRCKWALKPLSVLQVVSLIPFYVDVYFLFFEKRKTIDMGSLGSGDDDAFYEKHHLGHHRFKAGMALQGIRLLRLLSCLRLSHQPVRKLLRVFKKKNGELSVLLSGLMVLVVISGVVVYMLEHHVQPDKFSSATAGMWWSAETVTSLGYGDMVPKTVLGRAFASVLSMAGIFIFAVPAGVVSAGFVEQQQEEAALLARRTNADADADAYASRGGNGNSGFNGDGGGSRTRRRTRSNGVGAGASGQEMPSLRPTILTPTTQQLHQFVPSSSLLASPHKEPSARAKAKAAAAAAATADAEAANADADAEESTIAAARIEQKLDTLLQVQQAQAQQLEAQQTALKQMAEALERLALATTTTATAAGGRKSTSL